MKKVMLMLMTVLAFSLSAWCQSSVIIPIGNEVLTKNSLTSAKQIFNSNHMPLSMQSSTQGFFMEGQGDFSLMATVETNANGKIKEVSFLCGSMYWMGLEEELSNVGYKLVKTGKTTLGNGISVPQKTYANGVKKCLVRTLDNAMLQILFVRNTK